jgi:hypothetical protein
METMLRQELGSVQNSSVFQEEVTADSVVPLLQGLQFPDIHVVIVRLRWAESSISGPRDASTPVTPPVSTLLLVWSTQPPARSPPWIVASVPARSTLSVSQPSRPTRRTPLPTA